MPTRPEAFLEPLEKSELRPCAWIHRKKALCHTCPVGGMHDKYRQIPNFLPVEWSVCTSFWEFLGWDTLRSVALVGTLIWSAHWYGRVCPSSSCSRWRCALTGILEPQGAVPLGSNPPGRGYVFRLAPEAPILKRILMGPEAFLEPTGVPGQRPCARIHLKKGLVPHSSGRWDER